MVNTFFPSLIVAVYLWIFWLVLPVDVGIIILIMGSTLIYFKYPAKSIRNTSLPDFFLVSLIFSLFLSVYVSGQSYRGFLVSSPFFPGTLIYFILSRFANNPKDLNWVFFGISGMTGMIAFVVLVNYWLISNQTLMSPVGLGTSILIVPNDILILSVASPLVLSMALTEMNYSREVLAKITIILSLAAIFSLNSRSASIAILVGFSIVLLYYQGRGALFVISSYIVVFFVINELNNFSLANKLTLEPGCDARFPLWNAAINLWLQKPLIGHGIYSFGDLYREELKQIAVPLCTMTDQRFTPWPHNLFLELFVGQGVLGGIPVILIFGWVFIKSYIISRNKRSPYRNHAIGILGAAASFVLASFVELSFSRLWVVIIFMTLIGITATFTPNTNIHKRNES